MGARDRAYVIAFVTGAVAVLAFCVVVSVSLAGVISWLGVARDGPFAECCGELEAEAMAQLGAAAAVIATISGGAALLALYQMRRPT